jgi:hypothetical protein
MAVRLPVVTDVDSRTDTKLVTWTGLITGDTADPVTMPDWSDLTVLMDGTFAGGTSMALVGSMVVDGTYVALTDPQGNAISAKLAAFIEAVTEAPLFFKPTIASGAADSVAVRVLCRKANR